MAVWLGGDSCDTEIGGLGGDSCDTEIGGLGVDSCETEIGGWGVIHVRRNLGGWGDSWHDLVFHGEESDSELIKCTSTESE